MLAPTVYNKNKAMSKVGRRDPPPHFTILPTFLRNKLHKGYHYIISNF